MAQLSRNKNDIKETEANIHFKINNYEGDKVGYIWKFYCDNNYIEQIEEQNGTIEINELNKGTSYFIEGKCTIRVGTKYEIKDPVTNEGTGKYDYDYETYYENDSVNIYTHPGSFSMGAKSYQDYPNDSNSIIANVLTTKKVNQWINHFQKVYHWYNQNNNDYDTLLLQIPDNKIITATWFNACMDAMREVGHRESETTKVKGARSNPPGDIITADLINQMNFSGIN